MTHAKLVLGLAALALGAAACKGGAKDGKPAPPVRVKVERGDQRLSVQATGVVEPQNRVVVRPPLSGRVEEVLVREGDWVKRGQVLAWLSSTERAALLDAARARGPEELKKWEELYRPTPLLAPITGTLIARSTEPGQSVSSADPVVVLSDRLIVKAQVDETDIASVRVGSRAFIGLDAYPGREAEARVDHVAFEARTVNNVTIYDIEVLPAKVPAYMRSGMTANVEFVTEERLGVLTLPSEALKRVERGGFYVELPAEGSAQPLTKAVRVGLSDAARTEITEGLKEGEEVLAPSQALPSAANRGTNPFMPSRRGNVPRGAR